MGNLFITAGFVFIIVGIAVKILSKAGIPLLPGDIFIRTGQSTFYFPIVTSIIVSIIITLLINFFRRH